MLSGRFPFVHELFVFLMTIKKLVTESKGCGQNLDQIKVPIKK
jgi:hypothetical protein